MPKTPNRSKIKDEDFELVRAINAGETERFQELVKRHEQSLYNFGYRMCGNIQDTEDMVQDTFFNVFKYLKGFRYESKFKNWMYKIATSTCLKNRRKSKFAPDKELSLDESTSTNQSDPPSEVPDWAVLPLEKVLNNELAEQLSRAILDLPEKYRLVIVLRDIEGFSTEEAAQILGLTSTNVKVRLHRARLFVRDRMKAYFNDVG